MEFDPRFLWSGAAVFARLLPGLVWLPPLGGERLPLPARLALGLTLTACVAPGLPAGALPGSAVAWGLLLAKELAVGTVLAFAGLCLFEGLRSAGQLIDDLRGVAGSSALLPQTGERVAPLADMHLLLACAVFFAVGGPVRWLSALRESFEILPVTAYPAADLLERAVVWALDGSAAALRTAIALATPAAGAALAADCLLGFVQRVAPGLPVHFVGQPLRSALVLAWVGLTLAAGWEDVIRGWTG